MSPALTLVACGAPLAARVHDVAAEVIAAGWEVSVVATPSAVGWIDHDSVRRIVGQDVRVDYRSPDQPKRGPRPDAVVLCPATFNSINKVVAGIADTYALSVVCEALGDGVPVFVVPMVNGRLWRHFAWRASLDTLSNAGVVFVDIHTGQVRAQPVPSGTGAHVVDRFDPRWLTALLEGLSLGR